MQGDRNNVAFDVLQDWTASLAVGEVGEWTRAELRFADDLLEVWLDGRLAARVRDGSLGYGQAGWRVGAWDGAGAVEVAEVWRGGLY